MNSSEYETKLRHDLKGIIVELQSGLKLIENSSSEEEKRELHTIIIKMCSKFVDKQKEIAQ